jgi:NAD+ synthase (glutamine-hydrolysing)
LKIALVPINVRLGDFSGNLFIHQEKIREAVRKGASLVVFPELSLVGYSPMDLMERPSWDKAVSDLLDQLHRWLEKEFPHTAIVVGATLRGASVGGVSPRGRWNGAVFLAKGQRHERAKVLIPYYDVFHESRYFDSGDTFAGERGVISWGGEKIGLLVCEDSWSQLNRNGLPVHRKNPTTDLAALGATLLVNLSASPHEWGKRGQRRILLGAECRLGQAPFFYVNHFGGQNDLLFDGDAFCLNATGEVVAENLKASGELLIVESESIAKQPSSPAPTLSATHDWEETRSLLVEGISSYARKNGFSKAVLGLSGGIDSALVATLAVDALGPKNVTGLLMPSKYSSPHSLEDAEELASALGIEAYHLPIKMLHSTAAMTFKNAFAKAPEGLTDENLQSRLRGLLVMAAANEMGALALSTGNKSELAVGYSTLYGDLCGALLPIGDLFKTEVYSLAHWMRENGSPIPLRTLEKAPSAELRPHQKDEDSLPPYETLDRMLKGLVVDGLDVDECYSLLASKGKEVPKAEIQRVKAMVLSSEFKRFQAPPVLRMSPKAFGSGRYIPLSSCYL